MSAIQTRCGHLIDPFRPTPELIAIEDIGHALSNLCRFTGHTSEFYSVAEHSVHVSRLVLPAFALIGLLHDAAEAYFNDLAKPVKDLPSMTPYRHAEEALMGEVLQKFAGTRELPTDVKLADEAMLHFEGIMLMEAPWADASIAARASSIGELPCWTPTEARRQFFRRFAELTR